MVEGKKNAHDGAGEGALLAIDALVARLDAAGVAVERRDEWDQEETGRFARIHDPDGNPIELWEPPAA